MQVATALDRSRCDFRAAMTAALRVIPIQADKILIENSPKTFMVNELALIWTQRCLMNHR